MSTNYNIKFMAAHPVGMAFTSITNGVVLEAVEQALTNMGMTPIAGQCERGDDDNLFTQHEGKTWVHNAPDDLILAVARMLDGFVAQLVDPESDLVLTQDIQDRLGPWDEPNATAIADAFLEYRKKATS